MGFKKRYIVICLMLLMIFMGGVCAADTVSEDTISAGDDLNQTLAVDDHEEIEDLASGSNLDLSGSEGVLQATPEDKNEVLGASADEDILGDKEKMLALVKVNGYALKYATPEIQDDIFELNKYWTKNNKKDPSEVVIDEVAGQFIAYVIPTVLTTYFFNFVLNDFIYNSILLNLTSILMITCPFIFLRLFDISKPGLVGYFDTKVEGAIGIMMDDVVAGIYSGLISSLILISFFIVMILC